MISRPLRTFQVLLAALVCSACLLSPIPALSQDDGTGEHNTLIEQKLEWVISDLTRLIEEMRLIDEPENRIFLAEDIEEILYHEVEFPLIYRRAEFMGTPRTTSLPALPQDPDSEEPASELARLYATAFALGGIARGFEGFLPGAEDYIELARQSYDGVLDFKVKIDSFEEPRTVQQWIEEARERFAGTVTVRVTFNGRAVSQAAVDRLRGESIEFEAIQPAGRRYSLRVATRDFIKGINRRTITDDSLTWKRTNRFSIYLPPGEYRLITGARGQYTSRMHIESVPDLNFFLVETLGDGVTVYPVPHVEILESAVPGKKKQASRAGGSSTGGSDASH